jgi:hypothetical protein
MVGWWEQPAVSSSWTQSVRRVAPGTKNSVFPGKSCLKMITFSIFIINSIKLSFYLFFTVAG